MKQAMVPFVPELHELTPIDKFLDNYKEPAENRMIAHCEETSRIEIRSAMVSGKDTIILIGPEGDFTPQEIRAATDKNFIPVSLGNNRLRTETAGIVACCLLNA